MTNEDRERIADFYGLMISQVSKKARFFECLQTALSVLEYKGLPETLPAEYLLGYQLCNGTVGVGRIDGVEGIYCAPGGYCGEYNGYYPDHYRACVLGKGDLYGKAGEDIAVGWCNSTRTPELDIFLTADILHEVDVSEKIVTIYTRLLRIPKAKSDAEQTAIESAIQSLIDGNIKAVASDNTLTDVLSEISGGSGDNFVDLIDPDRIDQLQYLCQYRDNVLKRFMQRRGHPMQITSKLAQQTNAEMHGADSYSMIHPLELLKYQKRLCEDINRIFGLETSVELSELVKNNYDIVVNYVPDEMNEKGVINNDDTANVSDPKPTDGNGARGSERDSDGGGE